MSSRPINTLKPSEQVVLDKKFVMKIYNIGILFRRPLDEILVYRCINCSHCFETKNEEAEVRI